MFTTSPMGSDLEPIFIDVESPILRREPPVMFALEIHVNYVVGARYL